MLIFQALYFNFEILAIRELKMAVSPAFSPQPTSAPFTVATAGTEDETDVTEKGTIKNTMS